MRLDVSEATLAFAREYGAFTTPAARSSGWLEQDHEVRGEGDVMDLVGSLLLWKHLVGRGAPATVAVTANEGDEFDLAVTAPDGPITVNVKTSRYEWDGGSDPIAENYHLHVKEEELGRPLPDAFAQVFVYLSPVDGGAPRAHLGGMILTASETWKRQRVQRLPGTAGQRGYRVNRRDLIPLDEAVGRLLRRAGGPR